MPDIFDEVEEELRSERVQRFFARYGWAILALSVIIIVGIGVWRVRDWHLARQDQQAAAEYMVALNQAAAPGDAGAKGRDAALVMLDNLSAHGPAGYQTLARLRAAALLAEQGKMDAALHLYSAVAGDQSADPLLRDLATILWAQRQINTGDPQILKARLEPLAVPGNPWRPLAQQEMALLDIRQNQPAEAKKVLQSLAADLTAPPGVRETAALLLDRLGS